MPKKSDHFDGSRFHNNRGLKPRRSLWAILNWLVGRRATDWTPRLDNAQRKIPFQRTGDQEFWVTHINHSTCLIQINGLNILTDPIWSKRASPFSYFGPKRVCLPGVKLDDLPPIDVVLISHNHYDHMDIATLKLLEQQHHPSFITGLGNQSYLQSQGLKKVRELEWWDSVSLNATHQLTFVPAIHFSARGIFDRNKTLWGGFVLRSDPHLVYFAGDTAYGSHFLEIKERLGQPTFSMLPIGAFKPQSIMQPMHMSPKEAVQAYLDLQTKSALGIHYGTFQLSDESYDEPIIELNNALENNQLSPKCFWTLKPGESKKIESFS